MAGFNTTGLEVTYDGGLNWGTTDVRVMLMETGYTHDPDNDFVDDISADEITSQQREAIASDVISVDDTNNRIELDCADVVFGSLPTGDNPKKAQFYIYNAADGAAQLLFCCEESGTWPAGNGGDWTLVIDADGAGQVAA